MTDETPVVDVFRAELPDAVLTPGDDGYDDATSPHNSSFAQTPGVVVRPRTADDVARAVQLAAQYERPVLVQGSGHGAAEPVHDTVVLIDTSQLNTVAIDTAAHTATVGAGVPWSAVNAAAEPHGLLGPSGTSPTVAVAGYTFGGGVGWFVRKHGMAAAMLRSVEYVDATGRLRRASEDASEPVDREALWAFRGGAPVGVATSLEIGLIRVPELWTGYLLWPADALSAVAAAWSEATADIAEDVTSDLALLQLPPEGPFPEHLRGTAVVHLSYASPEGPAHLQRLRAAVVGAAEPAVDTTGPGDASALAAIHLDPPVAVPARGIGRWLNRPSAETIVEMFTAARVGTPGGMNMIELRHTDSRASFPDGMQTRMPAPFLLHAVAAAPDDDGRRRADTALGKVLAAARDADTGRSAPSFCEGTLGADRAFSADDMARVRAVKDSLDPARLFRFQRDPVRTANTL
ncbi:FAD/FMN-containing dehydrogenase [Mycolicibacterium rutilum]|uniref:FAD/FMN-containing dehydrogenase n=1 Tax=Mycolicibacterium rutilum TaxID=370526 RepID=A0A1H6KZ43_MYCRU|nr:FAD-binding oxidoreductase [Mycolicibacterium rutilum]SEH77089.1 FAD/FMN-containing dehydrogenase [Mycolicibacterium rutilum]